MYAIRSYYAELREIIEIPMVQAGAYLPEGALENPEIHEHSPRIQGFAPGVGEDPVVMPVKAFAFSVKIVQKIV